MSVTGTETACTEASAGDNRPALSRASFQPLLLAALLACAATPALAQDAPPTSPPSSQPPSSPMEPMLDESLRRPASNLVVKAGVAYNWSENASTVLLLDEGVQLDVGTAVLRADSAVLWLTKIRGTARQRVDAVLIGNVSVQTLDGERSGEQIAVDFIIEGRVRFDVDRRLAEDASDNPLFAQAVELRPEPEKTPVPATPETPANSETDQPADEKPRPTSVPIQLAAEGTIRTLEDTTGHVAVEVTGGVFLLHRTGEGDLVELRADRAVIFTALAKLEDLGKIDDADDPLDLATGVYLEGDVRASYLPNETNPDRDQRLKGEQRLSAETAFYDFTTNQATLGNVVLHSQLPDGALPLTLRAATLRQVAIGEYEAEQAELSTSRFASPEYSLNASRIYVRPGRGGERQIFGGDNLTLRGFGVPAFYFPTVRGATTGGRLPLRSVRVGSSRDFGQSLQTEWGLYETLGLTPPSSIDATYGLDYFSDRGPRLSLDADYQSDLLLSSRNASLFRGEFESELLYDNGDDNVGGIRPDVDQQGLRGRVNLKHAQFFPGDAARGGTDYAAVLRAGWVSDETYLEQWDRNDFFDGQPHDLQFYIARSRGSSLLSADVSLSTLEFASNADLIQEGGAVERLPEIAYYRFADRRGPLTAMSQVRLGILAYDNYGDQLPGFNLDATSPIGIASYGYTGVDQSGVPRGDLRQELDAPFTVGTFRFVPYLVGRVTAYGDSPESSSIARGLAGGGLRLSTAIARVDNGVFSRLLDLDRLRHVIEPGVEGFFGISNRSREAVYIYDESVDGWDELSAVSVSLRQAWQTYRGAPGRQRSVDVFRLNTTANWFGREPAEPAGPLPGGVMTANDFRGLYFSGLPEASLARDSINADALWRISDTVAIVGDSSVGLHDGDLLTVASGLVVDRNPRLSYQIGGRYVEPLDLVLGVGSVRYELSQRYTLVGGSRFDLEEGEVRDSIVGIQRRFDRVAFNVSLYTDLVDDDRGIRFSIIPLGIPGASLGLDSFN